MELKKIVLNSKADFKQLWINTVLQDYELFRGREAELDSLFEQFFNNSEIELFNSHKNKRTKMSLIEFIDTVYRENIIVIENGVMFSSKEEDVSPAVLTEEYLKNERGIVKNQAIYNLTEGDKVKGVIQNLVQDYIKLLMNKNLFRTFERVCARCC